MVEFGLACVWVDLVLVEAVVKAEAIKLFQSAVQFRSQLAKDVVYRTGAFHKKAFTLDYTMQYIMHILEGGLGVSQFAQTC